MANHLTITATHDGSIGNRELRNALRGVSADDISERSPVDAPVNLATYHETIEPEDEDDEPVHRSVVTSGEGDAEFTKTTTDALVDAISAIDGVTDVDVDGGYEPSSSTSTDGAGDDSPEDEGGDGEGDDGDGDEE